MTIAVHDASILIDLISIGLIGQVFAMNYRMVTTDFIMEELRPEQRSVLLPFIVDGRLRIDNADEETVVKIASLSDRHSSLSFADCSVLLKAARLSAILLTGDNKLRKTAVALQVEVHGILWVLEQLVVDRIITARTAGERLELLMQSNVRLPPDECRKCLDRWK